MIADGSELVDRQESDEYLEVSFDSLFEFFGRINPVAFSSRLKNDSASPLVEINSKGSPHQKDNKRYWIWGCATKGVLYLWHQKVFSPSFYNPVGCLDVSAAKQGGFLPCLGFQVESPAYFGLHAREGDRVLVMNPNYLEEVRDFVSKSCGTACEVIALGRVES